MTFWIANGPMNNDAIFSGVSDKEPHFLVHVVHRSRCAADGSHSIVSFMEVGASLESCPVAVEDEGLDRWSIRYTWK